MTLFFRFNLPMRNLNKVTVTFRTTPPASFNLPMRNLNFENDIFYMVYEVGFNLPMRNLNMNPSEVKVRKF